jgi:hypothetical protein
METVMRPGTGCAPPTTDHGMKELHNGIGSTKEYADSDGLYGRVNTQYAEFDGIALESGVLLGPHGGLRDVWDTIARA